MSNGQYHPIGDKVLLDLLAKADEADATRADGKIGMLMMEPNFIRHLTQHIRHLKEQHQVIAKSSNPTQTVQIPAVDTIWAINTEVLLARTKYPASKQTFAVLTKMVGDLARALLANEREGGLTGEIAVKAIQTAAMAVRIYEEGDEAFPRSVPTIPEVVPL